MPAPERAERVDGQAAGAAEAALPDEIRYLLFSPDELIQAVTQLCLRRGRWPSGSQLKSTELVGEPDVSFRVVLSRDPTGTTSELTFGAAELGAALVLYCMNRRIPLPARVEKSLQVVGRSLALAVSKGLPARPLREVAILDPPP